MTFQHVLVPTLIKGKVSACCKELEESGFVQLVGIALLELPQGLPQKSSNKQRQKKDELMLLNKADCHRGAPSGGGRPWHGPRG